MKKMENAVLHSKAAFFCLQTADSETNAENHPFFNGERRGKTAQINAVVDGTFLKKG